MIQRTIRLLARYSHVNWALADQTMVSGVNFLTGILLARYLGLEEFGRFTLAWMVVLFVNSIQYAVIISPMMSIGPKQPQVGMPSYYGALIVQQIAFSGLIFALVITVVHLSAVAFPEWEVDGFAFPLATAALIVQLQDFLRRYFFTRGRGVVAFVNGTIRYLGQLAMLLWLFLSFRDGMNTVKVLWVIAATAAIATMVGIVAVERVEWVFKAVRETTRKHWNFSKWLLGAALMQWTSGNLFILAAGSLSGAAAVGALKAAQNLLGVTHILFQGLDNIVPVRAALCFRHGGKVALLSYLWRVALFGELATAIIAVIAATAPEFWLKLFFGDDYSGYGYLVRWFAVIHLVIFIGLPLGAGLRAIEHTRTIFRALLWTTMFSLVAAYPVVYFLGLSGAVAGLLVTNLVLVVILLFDLRKRLVHGGLAPRTAGNQG